MQDFVLGHPRGRALPGLPGCRRAPARAETPCGQAGSASRFGPQSPHFRSRSVPELLPTTKSGAALSSSQGSPARIGRGEELQPADPKGQSVDQPSAYGGSTAREPGKWAARDPLRTHGTANPWAGGSGERWPAGERAHARRGTVAARLARIQPLLAGTARRGRVVRRPRPGARWFALFLLVYPVQWVRGFVRLVLWNRRRLRNLPSSDAGSGGPVRRVAAPRFVQPLGLRTVPAQGRRPAPRRFPDCLAAATAECEGEPRTSVDRCVGRGVRRRGRRQLALVGHPQPALRVRPFCHRRIRAQPRGERQAATGLLPFSRPIPAPGDGVVVQLRDGERAGPWPGGSGPVRARRGHFVVIRHGARNYILLTHLQGGSVCVRAGEKFGRARRSTVAGIPATPQSRTLHLHVQD